jgi:hypothetical protein
MTWENTTWNVTFVTDVHSVRNGSVVDLPTISVSIKRFLWNAKAHKSISSGGFPPSPKPTLSDVSKRVMNTNRPVFIHETPKLLFSSHSGKSFSEAIVTGPATHNASLFETKVADIHHMPARKGLNTRNTVSGFIFSPSWAIAIALNANWVLNSSGFLRSFLRFFHNVLSVMTEFSSGRSAVTGAHYDYA